MNDIFDALRDRYTYAVTRAERILLDVDLNGERRRPAHSLHRGPAAFTRAFPAPAPLDRVDVIKNGEVVFNKRFAAAPLSPAAAVQIGFRSSSEAFIRDNPRGYRRWKGTLRRGGRASCFRSSRTSTTDTPSIARLDAATPNRIAFSTDTRGGIDALVLDLDEVTPSTRIAIDLEQTTEHDVAPPQVRPYAKIPAVSLAFPFSELKEGLLLRESAVDQHVDSVFIQLVDPHAPKDGELDFVDRGTPHPGDYYYVRVTQLNGAHAWSSPVWVGGEPTR